MTHFQSTIQANLLQHELTNENIYMYTYIHLKNIKNSCLNAAIFHWPEHSAVPLSPAFTPAWKVSALYLCLTPERAGVDVESRRRLWEIGHKEETARRPSFVRCSAAARQEFLPSCTTCGSFYCARWCKCTSSSPAVCFPGLSTFSHPSIHFCFLWSPYSTSGSPPATSPPVRCAEKPSFNSAWLPTLPQSPPSSQRTPDSNSKIKRKSISLDHVFFPLPSKNLFSCLERILPDFNRVFSRASSVCRASPATRWC